VADAAQVARSTLHRYFPERSDLVAAIYRYAEEEVAAAAARARLGDGPADEALVRLALEYFDQWDAIVWVYLQSQAQAYGDDPLSDQADPVVGALIARGQADGSIDAAIPNAWLQNLLWAILYTAWEYVKQGATRHEAAARIEQTVRKLAAPGTGSPAK
jgi:AcrR family transcriptional regulator